MNVLLVEREEGERSERSSDESVHRNHMNAAGMRLHYVLQPTQNMCVCISGCSAVHVRMPLRCAQAEHSSLPKHMPCVIAGFVSYVVRYI